MKGTRRMRRYVFGKWRDLPGLLAAIKSMIFHGYLRERQYAGRHPGDRLKFIGLL